MALSSAPVRRRCASCTNDTMGDDSTRAAPARIGPSASPIGVRLQARTESRAAASRRASSGDAATSAVETRSARMRRTRQRPPASRSRSRWTTDTLAPNGRGCTKCTPSSTESRISRCEWPTTTTSGRLGSAASEAATFSPPIPVVSYEERPSIPEWISTTDRSASRRIASRIGAADGPTGATRTRPASWVPSQTIVPGVVKPVMAMRTPWRWRTRYGG